MSYIYSLLHIMVKMSCHTIISSFRGRLLNVMAGHLMEAQRQAACDHKRVHGALHGDVQVLVFTVRPGEVSTLDSWSHLMLGTKFGSKLGSLSHRHAVAVTCSQDVVTSTSGSGVHDVLGFRMHLCRRYYYPEAEACIDFSQTSLSVADNSATNDYRQAPVLRFGLRGHLH